MYHQAVMVKESLDGLRIDSAGIYVDVTFGGGGHSQAILEYLGKNGKLLGFDQDMDTRANAIHDPRFTLIQHNFRYLQNFLRYYEIEQTDGILADLGVSSHQFDTSSRGFSFKHDGPLDMRMNIATKLTAADIINQYDKSKLADIFVNYGEIKNGYALAQHIIESRTKFEINTISTLLKTVTPFTPKNQEFKFYARLLQALRIEVNDEINALKELLKQAGNALKPAGRLVVIAYHSLEDRLVKNFIKSGNFEGKIQKDFYGNPMVEFKAVNRKPITPTANELKNNPRSRSAKLRIAEKL